MKISCVCPTRQERRHFLPSMIDCFLSQGYGDRELIILDECAEPWKGCPLDNRIEYRALINIGARFTVGKKRNMVNALTHGEIIAHFDDDDFSHPERLTSQFETLIRTGARLVGFHDILYFRCNDRTLWKYEYQGKPQPYATGTTQMYWKEAWAEHPFGNKVVGEDSDFSFDFCRRKELFSENGGKMIVARAHGSNTYSPNFGSAPFLPATRDEFPQEFLRLVNM